MLPRLEEISKRRRLLGLSQKHLARLAGVSQSMIAKIEAGKTEPSYLKTKAIFRVLDKMQKEKEPHARDLLQPKVVGVDEDLNRRSLTSVASLEALPKKGSWIEWSQALAHENFRACPCPRNISGTTKILRRMLSCSKLIL